jgi:arylsulfatase A-like enzyme
MLPLLAILLLGSLPSLSTAAFGQTDVSLPKPAAPFKGKIGRTFESSAQDFPQPTRAPKGAPNVVVILLDDVGFGHPGTFGGPIPTPNLDKLANEGLRYNRFHTTAICSPTRAAVLTGLNHHQVGFGTIAELSTGYPGYDSVWPLEAVTVAEVLKQNGYSTAAWGKWHNTPDWETSPIGPFLRWPTGLGFEYWYGFHGGETSQWEPQLFRNEAPVEPPKRPEQGYHLTEDITDDAIGWIHRQKSIAPDKPFFIYFAPGAAHAPLHAPKEWIDKFKGQFDQGWDKVREETIARQKKLGVIPADTILTPRPKEIEAWDSLSPDAKRLYARHQEVFAGFLAHADYHVGRLLDAIKALPDASNTLIIYIAGDNGPSAEGSLTGTLNNMMTQSGIPDTVARQLPMLDEIGGPLHENHYPVGWSWAGSSPFQWMKRVPSHFGGTRNGLVISWPARINEKGGLRTQFHHVIDIVPTIYEAVGITAPTKVDGITQTSIAGVSVLYSFNDASAPGTRHTQYFETGGHRAIYHDGWVATAFHGVPWVLSGSAGNFDADKWELYNIDKDFSEANDLAAKEPGKLKKLQALFDEEAKKYDVYPLDDRFVERAINPDRPSVVRGRNTFSYSAGTTRIPEGSAPPIYQHSHKITANIVVPDSKTEGVIIATGGGSAGYSLFVKGGKVIYEYNFFGRATYRVVSNLPVPMGDVEVVLDYTQKPFKPFLESTGGPAKLFINGKPAGEGEIANVTPGRFSATETLDIGMDLGSTVSADYRDKAPFAFTGTIKNVTVDLK